MSAHPSTKAVTAAQLTIPDVAQALNCSPDTVRRMIARGELRAYRYGPRLIRIDPVSYTHLTLPTSDLV